MWLPVERKKAMDNTLPLASPRKALEKTVLKNGITVKTSVFF